jgi:hypothetical protein
VVEKGWAMLELSVDGIQGHNSIHTFMCVDEVFGVA